MNGKKTSDNVNKKPITVVITGAESTGKSTLTEWLANHFNTVFMPEYAREYVEKLSAKYTYNDVEHIAKQQKLQFDLLQKSNNSIVFADTWLIITKIWFEQVFQKKPHWIDSAIANSKVDLFLVCNIDLPWIPDSVRENGGSNRTNLHNKYIETIQMFGFNYKIISGENEVRLFNALQALNNFYKES